MNRKTRRAAAKRPTGVPEALSQATQALGALQEVQDLANRLGPVMEGLEALQAQIQHLHSALEASKADNELLRAQLARQREIHLRLFAAGMDVPLEKILLMEGEIENQIGSEPDADTYPRQTQDDPPSSPPTAS